MFEILFLGAPFIIWTHLPQPSFFSLPAGRQAGAAVWFSYQPVQPLASTRWFLVRRSFTIQFIVGGLKNPDSLLLLLVLSSPRLCQEQRPTTFLISLSPAPLVSVVPLFRRKPYIRLLLLQEPIPRAGVAIKYQPQRAMAGSALTRASAKELAQIAPWPAPWGVPAGFDKPPAFSASNRQLRPSAGPPLPPPSGGSSCA